MTRKTTKTITPDETSHWGTTLEDDFVAALHAHFRLHGARALDDLAMNPAAYLRLVATKKDRFRTEDAIDRMTEEELDREILKMADKLRAGGTREKPNREPR